MLCLLPSLAVAQPAQLLHTFTAPPAFPDGGLIELPDGSFYGVIKHGIIRRSPAGEVRQVARFPDGTALGPLVRASDGALYGVTFAGGPANRGTLFRFDPATGSLRVLHTFGTPSGGWGPLGGLVQVGGSLYGVAQRGPGDESGIAGRGTVFHVVLATGAVVTDVAFRSAALSSPAGPLTLGPDGRLYGVTNGDALYASTRPAAPSRTSTHWTALSATCPSR